MTRRKIGPLKKIDLTFHQSIASLLRNLVGYHIKTSRLIQLLVVKWIAESKSSTQNFQQSLTNPAESTDTTQIQLTKFADTESVVEQIPIEVPDIKMKNYTNPYPNQTPIQILTRNYRVARFAWGPTLVSQELEFPSLLLAIPAVAQHLSTFKWMRAGICVEVRINSTQFHYSALLLSWIPNHKGNKHADNLIRQSGNHPLVLSASTQQAACVNVPWINPYNFFDIALGQTTQSTAICKFYIAPMFPLTTATPNVTDTVEVQVFASFTDPEVTGYVQAQMSMRAKIKGEAVNKSKFGIITTMENIVQSVAQVINAVPMVGNALTEIASSIGIMDKPPYVGTVQPMSMSYSRDMSMGEGVDYGQPLSLCTLVQQGDMSSFMGEEDNTNNIDRVIRTPMITRVKTFTNGLPSLDWVATPITTEGVFLPTDDYLRFMSRMYAYWRGSIKYMLQFFTSTFVSCRMRVSVVYQPTTVAETITNGDIVSQVIDVKGDTVVAFTVPFLWPTTYRAVNDGITYPRIIITIISPIIGPSSDADPAIFLAVWRSAGEDFKFKQMVSWTPNVPVEEEEDEVEEIQAQMDIRSEFRKTFRPILDGSQYTFDCNCVIGEDITSMRQMAKRYVELTHTSTSQPTTTFPNNQSLGAFNRLALIHKYWSGSRRWKGQFLYDYTSSSNYRSMSIENPNGVLSAANGLAYTSPNQWGLLDVEIPWYSTLPMWYCDVSTAAIFNGTDAPQDILDGQLPRTPGDISWVSAGDDFMYGFLVAPPVIS